MLPKENLLDLSIEHLTNTNDVRYSFTRLAVRASSCRRGRFSLSYSVRFCLS